MIGYLENAGYSFGGVIRPGSRGVTLPDCLDLSDVAGASRKARLFSLHFSTAAATDGLTHKSLELANAIDAVCRFTGCKKVNIIAHSAGGLVARVYIQGALPGISYNDNVDKLITIGTPHLGSGLATHLGDFLGTRATALMPTSPLVRALNNDYPLPESVKYASVVIRGFAADVRGDGTDYDALADESLLAALPLDFREGGDQVIHVKSQNLALARCARAYERRSGRPIQYALARVVDPSPEDASPLEANVHTAATFDEDVQLLTRSFLEDDGFWTGIDASKQSDWIPRQCSLYLTSAIETVALRLHPASEVTKVKINDVSIERNDEYVFDGTARSVGNILGVFSRTTTVTGRMKMQFDEYGRIARVVYRTLDARDNDR